MMPNLKLDSDWILRHPPERGTTEHAHYIAGAKAEAAERVKGMDSDAKQVYNVVEILAQQGEGADYIVQYVARVFTADWSWRRKLKLAWLLLGPQKYRRQQRLKLLLAWLPVIVAGLLSVSVLVVLQRPPIEFVWVGLAWLFALSTTAWSIHRSKADDG